MKTVTNRVTPNGVTILYHVHNVLPAAARRQSLSLRQGEVARRKPSRREWLLQRRSRHSASRGGEAIPSVTA